MRVSNSLESEEGTIKFDGILEGPELDYVIQTGLNFLVFNGLLPIAKKSVDLHVNAAKEVQ